MSGIRVLVAEDQQLNYQLLDEYLTVMGHSVTWARDGAEAVRLARSGQFDVMVLDVHMPVLDGLEVMHALRAEPPANDLRVIVVTGDDGSGIQSGLIAAGVQRFMTKPIDLGALSAAIDSLAPDHSGHKK
jgi:CheY-like chemotaxis protein